MDDTDLIKELRMNIAERLEIPIWMISSPPFNYGLRFANGSVMAEICWDIADCMRATHGYDNERVSDWAELVRYNNVTGQWDHVEADGNPGWEQSGAGVGTPHTCFLELEALYSGYREPDCRGCMALGTQTFWLVSLDDGVARQVRFIREEVFAELAGLNPHVIHFMIESPVTSITKQQFEFMLGFDIPDPVWDFHRTRNSKDRRECGFLGCGNPHCEPVCTGEDQPAS